MSLAPADKIVAGKYELVELIGEGGMATVWRGLIRGAAGFSRPVAVKCIRSVFHRLKSYVDMFVEEARVGSDLNHPNIVQVFDFCLHDPYYYLIMEWIEGLDLHSFMRAHILTDEPVPWQVAVTIAHETLRGLSAAHERRSSGGEAIPVVHRDVSPQNVMLDVAGGVKLSDFGLARARDRLITLTAPGTVKGKLAYLSPEATRGKKATPHSDLFAMGSVLWEVLAGRRLFAGSTDLEVFQAIRACKVTPIDEVRSDLPKPLIEVVHRALEADPDKRYDSAREMALDLSECLRTLAGPRFDAQKLLSQYVGKARRTLHEKEGRVLRASPVQEDEATWSIEVLLDDDQR